jgi:hypothetical protein
MSEFRVYDPTIYLPTSVPREEPAEEEAAADLAAEPEPEDGPIVTAAELGLAPDELIQIPATIKPVQ